MPLHRRSEARRCRAAMLSNVYVAMMQGDALSGRKPLATILKPHLRASNLRANYLVRSVLRYKKGCPRNSENAIFGLRLYRIPYLVSQGVKPLVLLPLNCGNRPSRAYASMLSVVVYFGFVSFESFANQRVIRNVKEWLSDSFH